MPTPRIREDGLISRYSWIREERLGRTTWDRLTFAPKVTVGGEFVPRCLDATTPLDSISYFDSSVAALDVAEDGPQVLAPGQVRLQVQRHHIALRVAQQRVKLVAAQALSHMGGGLRRVEVATRPQAEHLL